MVVFVVLIGVAAWYYFTQYAVLSAKEQAYSADDKSPEAAVEMQEYRKVVEQEDVGIIDDHLEIRDDHVEIRDENAAFTDENENA